MKIALMTNNYKPVVGGVPISIERLAKGLRSLGHEVTIFAPTYEGVGEEKGVFRYKTLIKEFKGGVVLPNSLDPAIEKEFKDGGYDIIHVHHPFLIGNTAVHLSKKYNIPLTFTYHTRYEHYLSYAGAIKRLDTLSAHDGPIGSMSGKLRGFINDRMVPGYIRSFSRRCDFVFAPTPGMKEYLNKDCKVEEEKLRVLPTGLEDNEYSPEREKIKAIRKRYIQNGEFLFTSVSRISQEKNIDFLLDAVERLKKKTSIPFKLLMIGDGPERKRFEGEVSKRGLNEVIFLGNVENTDIKNYLAASDAFLFASKSETQGIVILEALAVSVPVIAVKATGVEDVVKDLENGILTKEDVEEFSSRLYSFMRGDINIDTMEMKALKTAMEYKEEKVAFAAANAYKAAINTRRYMTGRKEDGEKVLHIAG
ncbi:MAG: glycosyltransferase [Lachnospiraceae bacterium]|nr:glycosyltransferase [Lachnospiraceae bacterium]